MNNVPELNAFPVDDTVRQPLAARQDTSTEEPQEISTADEEETGPQRKRRRIIVLDAAAAATRKESLRRGVTTTAGGAAAVSLISKAPQAVEETLKETLSRRGTNSFRPMSGKTVEELLRRVVAHKEELQGWASRTEQTSFLENLCYLLEKYERYVATEETAGEEVDLQQTKKRTSSNGGGNGNQALIVAIEGLWCR